MVMCPRSMEPQNPCIHGRSITFQFYAKFMQNSHFVKARPNFQETSIRTVLGGVLSKPLPKSLLQKSLKPLKTGDLGTCDFLFKFQERCSKVVGLHNCMAMCFQHSSPHHFVSSWEPKGKAMVNSPLIRPYFLGGGIGGAPLGSHDILL